jgi:hypothetical protein
MPEHGSKMSTVPVVWANFFIFSFGAIQMMIIVIGDHGVAA